MPRGRGNNRGTNQNSSHGRGRGGGGRGTQGGGRGAFRGKRFNDPLYGDGTLVFEGNYEDFTLDHTLQPVSNGNVARGGGRGSSQTPRGNNRGGGRGSSQTPRGNNRGRGRGFFQIPGGGDRGRPPIRGSFPSPRGRGLGYSKGPRIPLAILERDRPLLQPIVFVPGEHQKTLFQEVEDILHVPGEEDQQLDDNAPSANIIEKIFHNEESAQSVPPDSDSNSELDDDEKAPEAELVNVATTVTETPETSSFIIDVVPKPVVFGPPRVAEDSSLTCAAPLGEDSTEEIIVYTAPYPRVSRAVTPVPPALLRSGVSDIHTPYTPIASSSAIVTDNVESFSFSLTSMPDPEEILTKQVKARSQSGLKPTPRSRKMVKKARASARRREERQSMFSLGLSQAGRAAMHERSTIRGDTRKSERRVGDSDVEWGTSDEEVDGVGHVTSGLGSMDLDSDIGEIAALSPLVGRLAGLREVVTIADLGDIAKIQDEDEEDRRSSSPEEEDNRRSSSLEEEEEIFNQAGQGEIGEYDTSDFESSEEETPRRTFQANLKKMREKAAGKAVADGNTTSDEEPSMFAHHLSVADRGEAYFQRTEEILDNSADHGNRKAIESEDFIKDNVEMEDISFNTRKKDKHIPPNLRDQWERDRAKKAERKQARELERKQATIDGALSHGGKLLKKQQKLFGKDNARIRGDTLYTGPIDSLGSLETLIRKFISNLELKHLELPPKPKDWRRQVHLLADAFRLKSKSQGKEKARYITLSKTTRSGVAQTNEHKVSRLVGGHSGKAARVYVRHKDGDEVGGAAPRLNDTNVGFKLLQQMGWSEGDRIGATAGLADPLTAIVKTTKLGLGATR
ncbi:hypothetical protein BU17DRAFT_79155 [Hysterangium stoloniferum]|nr:hypothetical protein BU17DRAFT_79155 [Hysterangium stoloniferum]